jgi:hypothetical protein
MPSSIFLAYSSTLSIDIKLKMALYAFYIHPQISIR